MKIVQKLSKIFGAFLLTALAGFFFSAQPVFAADEEIPDYRLQVSPASIDVGDLKPGETHSGIMKVQNTGKKPFKFRVSATPYSVVDEKYTQNFEDTNQYTDIKDWIKFSQSTGEVEPNNEVEVAYTITVPADVPAGGQYAVLMTEIINEGETGDGNTGISAIRRVGMLLYSNVEGNTRKTGEVVENKIPGFMFNPPITATSIVSNTGNTHARAKYILQVYPLFGDEEVYTNEEDPTVLTILPETRRMNTINWPGSPSLGIFRVKQTVTIFDQTSVTEKLVVLCPIWFLFLILVIIFFIIFWIFSRIRSRQQNK